MSKLSFKAIAFGFLLDTGLSTVLGMIAGVAWSVYKIAVMHIPAKVLADSNFVQHAMFSSIPVMVIFAVIGLFGTVVGGALTGYLAPAQSRLINAVVLGVLETVLGLLMGMNLPLWYIVLCVITTTPSALFGAYIVHLVKSDLKG